MDKINELKLTAAKARLMAVDAVHEAKSGHPGGSLSCMDALVALYFSEMNIDPENPAWEDRDRFVLSKGHCSPALYSVLALRGYYPVEKVKLFRSIRDHFSGHPDMKNVPGVDMSTGSLGQGLSCAVGMALAAKHNGKSYRTYAICGDGEIAEGQIWEAAMAAANFKVSNLIGILDNNKIQATGPIKERMDSGDLKSKWEAFGWRVIEIDGHNVEEVLVALDEADKTEGRPTLILMHTIKGKGLSFAENTAAYHNGTLTEETYAQALKELS